VCDRGAADAEQFGQCLLRQRQDITAIRPIVNVKEPAGKARFDGMQRVAGRDVLDLREYRPGENLDHRCDGRTVFERRLKLCGRDLPRVPGYPDNCRHGRSGRSDRRHEADDAVVADHGGGGALPFGNSMMKAIAPLQGK